MRGGWGFPIWRMANRVVGQVGTLLADNRSAGRHDFAIGRDLLFLPASAWTYYRDYSNQSEKYTHFTNQLAQSAVMYQEAASQLQQSLAHTAEAFKTLAEQQKEMHDYITEMLSHKSGLFGFVVEMHEALTAFDEHHPRQGWRLKLRQFAHVCRLILVLFGSYVRYYCFDRFVLMRLYSKIAALAGSAALFLMLPASLVLAGMLSVLAVYLAYSFYDYISSIAKIVSFSVNLGDELYAQAHPLNQDRLFSSVEKHIEYRVLLQSHLRALASFQGDQRAHQGLVAALESSEIDVVHAMKCLNQLRYQLSEVHVKRLSELNTNNPEALNRQLQKISFLLGAGFSKEALSQIVSAYHEISSEHREEVQSQLSDFQALDKIESLLTLVPPFDALLAQERMGHSDFSKQLSDAVHSLSKEGQEEAHHLLSKRVLWADFLCAKTMLSDASFKKNDPEAWQRLEARYRIEIKHSAILADTTVGRIKELLRDRLRQEEASPLRDLIRKDMDHFLTESNLYQWYRTAKIEHAKGGPLQAWYALILESAWGQRFDYWDAQFNRFCDRALQDHLDAVAQDPSWGPLLQSEASRCLERLQKLEGACGQENPLGEFDRFFITLERLSVMLEHAPPTEKEGAVQFLKDRVQAWQAMTTQVSIPQRYQQIEDCSQRLGATIEACVHQIENLGQPSRKDGEDRMQGLGLESFIEAMESSLMMGRHAVGIWSNLKKMKEKMDMTLAHNSFFQFLTERMFDVKLSAELSSMASKASFEERIQQASITQTWGHTAGDLDASVDSQPDLPDVVLDVPVGDGWGFSYKELEALMQEGVLDEAESVEATLFQWTSDMVRACGQAWKSVQQVGVAAVEGLHQCSARTEQVLEGLVQSHSVGVTLLEQIEPSFEHLSQFASQDWMDWLQDISFFIQSEYAQFHQHVFADMQIALDLGVSSDFFQSGHEIEVGNFEEAIFNELHKDNIFHYAQWNTPLRITMVALCALLTGGTFLGVCFLLYHATTHFERQKSKEIAARIQVAQENLTPFYEMRAQSMARLRSKFNEVQKHAQSIMAQGKHLMSQQEVAELLSLIRGKNGELRAMLLSNPQKVLGWVHVLLGHADELRSSSEQFVHAVRAVQSFMDELSLAKDLSVRIEQGILSSHLKLSDFKFMNTAFISEHALILASNTTQPVPKDIVRSHYLYVREQHGRDRVASETQEQTSTFEIKTGFSP